AHLRYSNRSFGKFSRAETTSGREKRKRRIHRMAAAKSSKSAKQKPLKILIRRSAIEKRVREVAQAITKDFQGQRVHLIGVLKGACIFLSDLVREIDLETSIDFIAVSSYGKGKESSGQVRVLKDLD